LLSEGWADAVKRRAAAWCGVRVDGGSPLGPSAGLLILLGNDDDRHTIRPDPRDWPLPLSSDLGVRIYESRV
jgi:hypothetical protein